MSVLLSLHFTVRVEETQMVKSLYICVALSKKKRERENESSTMNSTCTFIHHLIKFLLFGQKNIVSDMMIVDVFCNVESCLCLPAVDR